MSILFDDKGLADTCVCDGCGRQIVSIHRKNGNATVHDFAYSDDIPDGYELAPQRFAYWEVDLVGNGRMGWRMDSENVICPSCVDTAIDYWLTRKGDAA